MEKITNTLKLTLINWCRRFSYTTCIIFTQFLSMIQWTQKKLIGTAMKNHPIVKKILEIIIIIILS